MTDGLVKRPSALRGRLLHQVALAPYTSWRIGGLAEHVYFPADLLDLSQFLKSLPHAVPLTWLGLGSNTLVRDQGVRGVVVITQGGLNQLSSLDTVSDHVLNIRAETGVSSAQLARYAARLGGAELAFMAGIPGTVGGALAMNAGCFDGETWRFVTMVEMMTREGNLCMRPASEFRVAYRSVSRVANEWFVAGHFSVARSQPEEGINKIRDFLAKRALTQPTGLFNCGSVFRNPLPHYAGQLIEQCGLKGMRQGGAMVSEKHANFIINMQQARSGDVEQLIAHIAQRVFAQTGITLIPEVCMMGEG